MLAGRPDIRVHLPSHAVGGRPDVPQVALVQVGIAAEHVQLVCDAGRAEPHPLLPGRSLADAGPLDAVFRPPHVVVGRLVRVAGLGWGRSRAVN